MSWGWGAHATGVLYIQGYGTEGYIVSQAAAEGAQAHASVVGGGYSSSIVGAQLGVEGAQAQCHGAEKRRAVRKGRRRMMAAAMGSLTCAAQKMQKELKKGKQ